MRGGVSTLDVDEGGAEFTLKDGTHIDLSRRQVRKKDQIIHLTPAEGRLLRVLIENPGRVYSHRELVLLVQGYSTSQREAPEILRPLVSRLRHKLELFPSLSDRIVVCAEQAIYTKGISREFSLSSRRMKSKDHRIRLVVFSHSWIFIQCGDKE